MDIEMLKEQKINRKLQSILIKDEPITAVTFSKKENVLEVCLNNQRKAFIEQYQRRPEMPKSAEQQRVMKDASRLIEEQWKRMEKETLEEKKRQKARDEFMKKYHAKQRERGSERKEKLLEMKESDLNWHFPAVKETEEIFTQISREWGMK